MELCRIIKDYSLINMDIYLCQANIPINSANSCLGRTILDNRNNSICDIRLLKIYYEMWYKLNHPNNWIFVVPNTTEVGVTCSNTFKTITLQGSGILSLSPGCSAENQYIKLRTIFITPVNTTLDTIKPNLIDLAPIKLDMGNKPIDLPNVHSTSLIDSTSKLLKFSKGLKEIELEIENHKRNLDVLNSRRQYLIIIFSTISLSVILGIIIFVIRK